MIPLEMYDQLTVCNWSPMNATIYACYTLLVPQYMEQHVIYLCTDPSKNITTMNMSMHLNRNKSRNLNMNMYKSKLIRILQICVEYNIFS